MLFGITFSRTVATFPQAIFVVGASAIALALFCTLLVRLPKGGVDEIVVMKEDEALDDEERERLVPTGEEEAH